jgi:hypothetical protein
MWDLIRYCGHFFVVVDVESLEMMIVAKKKPLHIQPLSEVVKSTTVAVSDNLIERILSEVLNSDKSFLCLRREKIYIYIFFKKKFYYYKREIYI